MAVLGSPSLIRLMVSVDVKYHERRKSSVKVEVIVKGSPSLISLMVSEHVKYHERRKSSLKVEVIVLGSPYPNKPNGFYGN